MPRLFVNLDHVATIRQARGTPYPDVLEAAQLAARTGLVEGITLHLREDRRHVQDSDMRKVAAGVSLPLNFEMSTAEDVVQLAVEIRPPLATIVPERREEVTTEGGLDVVGQAPRLREVMARLQAVGTKISLFIEPSEIAVRGAKALGAEAIELHTGPYVHAHGDEVRGELERLRKAADLARELALELNAGHGLTVQNVGPVAALPGLLDLNIGHAIVARSVFVGLESALREMRTAIAAGALAAESR